MKKHIVSILVLSILFISCKEKAKEEKTETAPKAAIEQVADANYTANTETSVLNWKGFKPTGMHNGTVAIKTGSLKVNEGKLIGGDFVFDMSSITVLDIPAEEDSNGKLKSHLESKDFFDVANNPTATFVITEVTEGEATLVKGDLTIKGITKSIEFPASLTTTETGVKLTGATFKIDRTEFNIQYKSQKFFDNLKDKFINDEFEISFEVNASK
ncbi:YceI family protein [Lutibacter sp. A64]|uniref:YceI family protein n=1 Tax=Lutibacter sp. A64 TaxID=2918526 RepID=UPI001F06CF84|nr:YceI family protein [Lutibacter sp. A64]UMB52475.1 YceI family protein [Lutibacter sp. A64]